MRHRKSGRKLNRTSSHRMAMLRNMVTDFLDKERIVTTVPKAKELRSFAEKMITLGKRENLHARRKALSVIRRKTVVHKLFDDLGPRYADRPGGYTRIIRLGTVRKGDATEMAILELVESEMSSEPKAEKPKKTKPAATAKVVAKEPEPKKEAESAASAEPEGSDEASAPQEAAAEAEGDSKEKAETGNADSAETEDKKGD